MFHLEGTSIRICLIQYSVEISNIMEGVTLYRQYYLDGVCTCTYAYSLGKCPIRFFFRCPSIFGVNIYTKVSPNNLPQIFLFLLVSAPSITSSIRLRGFTGLFTHKNDGFWSAFRVSLRLFNRRNFGASEATILNRRTNWIIFKINYLHKMWLC